MTLHAQSAQIRQIRQHRGLIYIFSSNGVDIYRRADWQRVAWATLAGVRSGAVNDLGVWLASESGLWHLPLGTMGASGSRLTLTYTDASATALQSADVLGVAAAGPALLVVTAAGVDYLPTPGEVCRFTTAGCPGACAIGTGKIAYAVADGLHLLDEPADDWTADDVIILTASSDPALLSSTVLTLAWGADLFIGTEAGLNIYAPATESMSSVTAALGDISSVRTIFPAGLAAATSGHCAFGTSDGAGGGQFGILRLG